MEIARRSIGEISVICIDDVYPLFKAPKGTFAFNTNGDYFVSNGKIWYQILTNVYGEIYVLGNTTNLGNVTVGSWYTHEIMYTAETLNGVSHDSLDALYIPSGNPMRLLAESSVQLLNGSTRLWEVETNFTLKNNLSSYPTAINISGNSISNDATTTRSHIKNSTIYTLNPNTNDKIRLGFRVTYRSGTGTFTMPNRKLTVIGFDRSYLLDESHFEGSFEDEGWTAVNGTETNKWYILSSNGYSGNSACISNDGVNQTYTNTSTSIVHLYKDIEFPKFLNGILISFAWKCNGEIGYDFGNVWLAQTSFTPTAGIAITTENAILLGKSPYVSSSTWNNVTDIKLQGTDLDNFKGKTVRLIFEWKNNSSLGTAPGFCIDDVMIYAFIGGDEREFILRETFTSLTGWITAQEAQANYWIAGTDASGVFQKGGSGIYITNNGRNAQYSNISSLSHIYRDITFPDEEGDFYIEFMWKCNGEDYDFGRIYLLDTSDTPVAGSFPDSLKQIGRLKYFGKSTWNYEKILLSNVRNTTKKLTFTWVNNGSISINPGMCISNLKIYKE